MLSAPKSIRWACLTSALALTVGLASCQPQTPSAPPQAEGGSPAPAGGGQTVSLSGAGATFPAPLYQSWFSEYNQQNPNVQISYQSVGSGAGVQQYLAKTVDFGASDAPLTDKERQEFVSKYKSEPIQLPMTGGAVVFAYNLEGVDNLQLSREAYCGIVDGSVKTWNDPLIAKNNEGAKLPNSPITFVHRSDGSGTTFIFTSHIEAACPNWKAGSGKSVEWPTGTGGKGNEGVTAQIQQTQGAVGYIEYSYAKENNISMAAIQNKAGEFVEPNPEAASKAFAGTTVPEDFSLTVPDPDGKEAYPIAGLTWLLVYGEYQDQAKADALKNFVKWAYSEGDKTADKLGYLPIPDEVSDRAVATLDTIKVAQGN